MNCINTHITLGNGDSASWNLRVEGINQIYKTMFEKTCSMSTLCLALTIPCHHRSKWKPFSCSLAKISKYLYTPSSGIQY